MRHDPAYTQLLNLISARSQQWLRGRMERMTSAGRPDDTANRDISHIAIGAYICSGLRGSPSPLKVLFERRFGSELIDAFIAEYQYNSLSEAFSRSFRPIQTPGRGEGAAETSKCDVAALCVELQDGRVPASVEAILRKPIARERITDAVIDDYAALLALCYRFGAARPRFASARTYGDAFANCLRLADWAHRKGRLEPLAQMCFALCLIDPDHDVAPLLADLIASQRPDGSFPARLGFGTADQDAEGLRPTLAAIVALQMAVHRRWNTPRPLSMAA